LKAHSALLFDLGGTHLRCACLSENGEIVNLTRERIRSFHYGISTAEIWNELLKKFELYTAASQHLVEIPPRLSFLFLARCTRTDES